MQTISVTEALTLKTKCKLTFDLMLDYPGAEVKKLIADKRVTSIILNIDAQENIHDLIDYIHFHNKEVGISLNPDTHFYQIVPYLAELDIIQIFTVEPGAQGNPYLPERLRLASDLKTFGFLGKIGVDGGVNKNNLMNIAKHGIDIASVGSAISKATDPASAYEGLVSLTKNLN